MPTGLTKLGNHLFFFHPDKIVFDLTAVEDESPVKQYLQKVCDIFQSKLLDMCGPNCTPVPETKVKINFNVAQFDLKLDWKTDESYALNVSKTGEFSPKFFNNFFLESLHVIKTILIQMQLI